MKKALITGASRGIGAAIAKKLAKEGYDLILVCHHNESQLLDLAHELEGAYSISCTTKCCDVSNYGQVADLFNSISHIDVVINNAGVSYVGLLTDMSEEDWHTIIDTNLSSLFHTSKFAVPLMVHEHSGKIINISSMWGNVGASTEVAYSASKGGMNSFTKALAKELAPSNIQVNAIACGVIDTDMNRCFSKEDMDELITEIPADRIGQPGEVADLVLQVLNSPSYMTGQIITLDGGFC